MSQRSWVQVPPGAFSPFSSSRLLMDILVHLAQLVERKTFNLVAAGSSPAVDINPLVGTCLNSLIIN